jgi:hypothetical protein
LFGHLKNRLQGQQRESADELLSGVRKILNEISQGILEVVFWEWINRLDQCTAAFQQTESTCKHATNGPLSYS